MMNESETAETSLPDMCPYSNETFSRVQLLYSNRIISWPNFTHCLPHCGMCGSGVHDSTYEIYNLLLIGFVLPLIGFCGLIGNGMSAFVYSRPGAKLAIKGKSFQYKDSDRCRAPKHLVGTAEFPKRTRDFEMHSSTNLYLCALGCSDSAVICTAIFVFAVDSIKRYSLQLSILFGALSPLVYPAAMTAQMCSVYFTLVAGIDCFVHVCLPERCRRFVSKAIFVKCAVLFVVVFSILYNVPHCFEAVVIECWHPQFQSRSIEVCADPFRYVESYSVIYYGYMYAIFLAIGPLVVLIVLNVCIIVASVISGTGGSSGDTITLVLVVLLFIVCNAAALLLNAFEARLSKLLGPKINYIVDGSNLLVVFNSSFNFIIYVTFSDAFRATLLQYFSMPKSLGCEKNSVSRGNARLVPIDDRQQQTARKQTIGRLLKAAQPEVLI